MASSVAETAIEQGQTGKITLHWLEKSRSHRVLWLLEETNAPYELKTYKRDKNFRADKALEKVHPLGKSPVVTIESAATPADKPLVLPESAFITEYALDYFGKQFVPARWREGQEGKLGGETVTWTKYRAWMHYAEGSLMTMLMIGLIVHNLKNAPVPFFVKPIPRAVAAGVEKQFLTKELELHFGYVESELKASTGPFLCGDQLTGADFMMIFPLQLALAMVPGADKYTAIKEYVKRLEEREAYKRAIKKIVDEHGEFSMKL